MPPLLRHILNFFSKTFGVLVGGLIYPVKALLTGLVVSLLLAGYILFLAILTPIQYFFKTLFDSPVEALIVTPFYFLITGTLVALAFSAMAVLVPLITASYAYVTFREGIRIGYTRGLWAVLSEFFTRVVHGEIPGFDPASQNTHTASVHASATESANRLMLSYGDQISSDDVLEAKLAEIARELNRMPSEGGRNSPINAGRRGFARLSGVNYTDPGSNVSLKQIMALSWIALNDSVKRDPGCTLAEARASFVNALYDCQRGYNLHKTTFKDNGKRDVSICPPGSFNKFIERLVGLHPDAEIRLITVGTASEKFVIVVKEESHDYLRRIAATEPERLQDQVALIERDGLEPVWAEIEGSVRRRMFEEFGEVYRNDEDPAYVSLTQNLDSINVDLTEFKVQAPAPRDYIPQALGGYIPGWMRTRFGIFAPAGSPARAGHENDTSCAVEDADMVTGCDDSPIRPGG